MARDTMLILENDDASSDSLADIFQDKFKIIKVRSEKEGIDVLRDQVSSLAVVLVNLLIPAKDNFQILQRLSEKKFLERIPFIMITSDKAEKYEKKDMSMALSVILKSRFMLML